MEFIDQTWKLALAGTAIWSTFFSMFNRPGVRGWRNLGLLAGYAVGVLMFVILAWRSALATWAVMAVVTGVLYLGYEVFAYIRARSNADAARPRLGALIHALLLWPIMLPEAIEYLLADLGVLKAADSGNGT